MKQKCKYSRHTCRRYQYRNYKFCFQHILEDKSAPFMPCQYISNITKRRCHNPALKYLHSSIALCDVHQQSTSLARSYKRKSQSNFENRGTYDFMEEYDDAEDVSDCRQRGVSGSSHDHDANVNSNWLTTVSSNWKNSEVDIDTDSGEEEENPLVNSNVLSLEEVVATSKQRLVKLKSLYVKQFGHLRRQLQAKRKQYLLNEVTNHSSISDDQKSCRLESAKKQELNSLINFRRHKWKNHLLHRKSKIRRLETTTSHSMGNLDPLPSPNKVKCCHVTNHVKCKIACLPYTKYCNAHILEDPLQVMYRKCSSGSCPIPVCSMWSYDKIADDELFCPLHYSLPPVNQDLLQMMTSIKEDLNRIAENSSTASSLLVTESDPIDPAATKDDTSSRTRCDEANDLSLDEQSNSTTWQKATEEPMECDSTSDKTEQPPNHPSLEQLGTSQKHLSPADIDLFKTGQHYLMNRISVVDQTGLACKGAIHLEPVDCFVSVKSKVVRSDTNNTVDDSVSVDANSDKQKRKSADRETDAKLKETNDFEEDKSKTKGSKITRKVTAAATVIPPLGPNVTAEAKGDRNCDNPESQTLLPKMPPLAPIETPDQTSPAPSSPEKEPSVAMEVDQSDAQASTESIDGDDKQGDTGNSEEGYSLDSIMQPPPSTLSADLSDNSSNEASRNIKGGDADDAVLVSERKPSSADEETAIASLLFLSSGTLGKH